MIRLVAIPGPLGKYAVLVYHQSGALWMATELPSLETVIVRVRGVFGAMQWKRLEKPRRWEATP